MKNVDFEINSSLKVVILTSTTVKPPGEGSTSDLIPVYNLNSSELVRSIGTNGTVHISFKGEELTLSSSEEYTKEYWERRLGYDANVQTQFENYGLLDKDKIKESGE